MLEFRLTGSAREFVKETAVRIGKTFYVHGVTQKRVVPHVSMVGPFRTDDERRLIREFEATCINYEQLTFRFNGLRTFGSWLTGNRVLAVNIEPSEELVRLRSELVSKFSGFCYMGKHDMGKYSPHATLAFKDIDRKFGKIKEYLASMEIPPIRHSVLRITLVGKGSRIVSEFDLFQRRSLTRPEALNRENRKLTLALMQARVEGDLIGTSPGRPFEISPETKAFVVSDTHFDHENIIRYCNRPFESARQMNDMMVRNWNNTVGRSDVVFFLGDFAFGREHNPIDYWLGKLNGRVFFLRGNHDLDAVTKALEIPSCFFIHYRGQDLMLTHDPLRPASWKGWMIHGDKHNNSPDAYPFIKCSNKTMNVCVEMIGYKPLSLDGVLQAISRC
ncbi:MAG: 2'-5' RNA ligase family protein [Thaumarchaeota archaeon]|nr:2'-5' RNA ligase family protein [Nitrososphaerota archaeon]